ncbi:hypothetical protein MJT46_015045 [Ovis ammon polii x Ovis aries]|nr:hypothetical protein MJT46_015045 [Ovis ammon polii x Ovis aries]
MSFLTQQPGPDLVDAAQARPSDNCIFSVELQLPPKAAALAHLDRGSPPPAQEALAIFFFGKQPQPNVTELLVGPLPQPSYMRDVTVERHGGPLPYYRCPLILRESQDIDQMIFNRELPQAAGVLCHCCSYRQGGRKLVMLTTASRGVQSGNRAMWFGLYYISGFGVYLHPVGLDLLVDHKALDPAQWTVQKVFFQGRYYESLAQLEEQFEAGQVNVVVIPDNGTGGSWSLKSQVPPGPAPPLQFHPQGARFNVQGSQVTSSLWTFSFGLGAFSGPRIFDVRFQGERLAYEISLQEVLVVYVLVFRSVSTLFNYDYVWDVIFHSNGAIQVKFYATGFINSVFHFGAARRYGYQSISRYQLAVTQRKETEPRSSSIFNQNDPWTPMVVFADFVNNETIAGKDLVAWVTAGFLRIPHAEDIPNTVTVGNSVGFFLRPYNFFDEDPSINSADSIFFQENQDAGSCESGDRPTQFGLYYNIAKGGSYLHLVGLALHVDHKALDPAQWTIQKVFFQGRYYESLAQLEEQFEAGQVNVVVIPNNGTGGSWSLKSQVSPGPAPPLQFHPQSPCFNVQSNQVSSSLWTFSFDLRAFSGPGILTFDYKENDWLMRSAYKWPALFMVWEYPTAMFTRPVNSGIGMGYFPTPLIRVECPYQASYMDWHFVVESQAPKTPHDAFGVFKQNKGLPLR